MSLNVTKLLWKSPFRHSSKRLSSIAMSNLFFESFDWTRCLNRTKYVLPRSNVTRFLFIHSHIKNRCRKKIAGFQVENFLMEVDETIYFQNLVSKNRLQRSGTNFISRARRIFSLQTKRTRTCFPSTAPIT